MKIVYLHRDASLKRLKKIARRIKAQHPEVVDIRLFSSLKRGDYTAASDADLLIVRERCTENDPHRRILMFSPYLDLRHGVDLLVYTRSEIESHLNQGDSFLQKILKESIAIVDPPESHKIRVV